MVKMETNGNFISEDRPKLKSRPHYRTISNLVIVQFFYTDAATAPTANSATDSKICTLQFASQLLVILSRQV